MNSKTPKTLLFRADGGVKLGFGHLRRCLALASAAKDQGYQPILVTRTTPANLKKMSSPPNMPICHLAHALNLADDATRTARIAQQHHSRTVIVDGYTFKSAFFRRLRQAQLNVVAIKDEVTSSPDINLIINSNPAVKKSHYRKLGREKGVLAGAKYIMIGNDILRQRHHQETSQLLISLGGARWPNELLCQIARGLQPISHHFKKITWVLHDSLGPSWQTLLPKNTSIQAPGGNFPRQLAGATLVLTGGGVTLGECAFLGKPSVTLILAKNQAAHALSYAKNGTTFPIPALLKTDWRQLSKRLPEVFTPLLNHAKRNRMSQAGRHLVDGRGANRVIQAISKSFY